MINPNIITKISKAEDISWATVEKDYFLTMLLEGIAQNPFLKKTFVFKGGTALRKIYFENYRYSEDLDFTLRKTLTAQEIRDSLETVLQFLKTEHNAEFIINDFNSKSYFTDVKVRFIGLKKTKSIVSFDLSPSEIIVDEPFEKIVFNPYYEKEFTLPTYTLEEIVAEKLRSLLQRIRVRDYYDVWYLLTKNKDKLNEKRIKKIFLKKVEFKNINFTDKTELLKTENLEQAKAYYNSQLGNQIKNLPSFDQISEELKQAINTIEL